MQLICIMLPLYLDYMKYAQKNCPLYLDYIRYLKTNRVPPFHFGEWGIPLFTLVNFVEWGPPFALWLILVNGVPLILVTLGYIRGYIRGHNGVTLGLHSIT